MSLEAWIFMVGFRVVDLGALVAWLVWFYRQCDKEDDESDGEDFRRHHDDEPDRPPAPVGGSGLDLPLPDAAPWPDRRRGHDDTTWPPKRPERRVPDRHREPTPLGAPLIRD
jgi:hypothetical protein